MPNKNIVIGGNEVGFPTPCIKCQHFHDKDMPCPEKEINENLLKPNSPPPDAHGKI